MKLATPFFAGFAPVLIAAQPAADSAGSVETSGPAVPAAASFWRFGSWPSAIMRSVMRQSAPSKPRTTTRPAGVLRGAPAPPCRCSDEAERQRQGEAGNEDRWCGAASWGGTERVAGDYDEGPGATGGIQ